MSKNECRMPESESRGGKSLRHSTFPAPRGDHGHRVQPGSSIWIVRHGERLDHADPPWLEDAPEPLNPPLSATGVQQAKNLGAYLANQGVGHIFASPFRRTLQTASRVAEVLDLPVKVEYGAGEQLSPDWYPSDPRVWTMDDLQREFPLVDASYESVVMPTYPEDWEQCKARARKTIRRLVERFGGGLLLVGHGASVSGLAWGLLDDFPQFKNQCCGPVKIVRNEEGSWDLQLDGDNGVIG